MKIQAHTITKWRNVYALTLTGAEIEPDNRVCRYCGMNFDMHNYTCTPEDVDV